MSIPAHNERVQMILDPVPVIPAFLLPSYLRLRMYRPGDECHWLHIHHLADTFQEVTLEHFEVEFFYATEELPRRQFYLETTAGDVIGTGTAWFDPQYKGGHFGRIHWVAIVPEYQGRGLAKPLMTALLNRHHELGEDRVYLTTSTARLPAICLYLKFGFIPDIVTDLDLHAWGLVAQHLPVIAPYLHHNDQTDTL